MALTLHFHPLSSFCWKVLIALYENDTAFRPNKIDLGDPEQLGQFLKLWPIGKIPVLSDADSGDVVPESSIIIEYLDHHHPGRTRFIPADPDLALHTRLRDRFHDLYLHLSIQKIIGDRLRPRGSKDPHGVAEARARVRACYAILDRQADTGPWAMGEAFTLADCAAFPALFYGNMVQPFGSEHGNVAAYFERLKARPAIARVLAEAEPWFDMVPRED